MNVGIQLQVKVTGVKEIQQAIKQLSHKATHLAPAFDVAGIWLVGKTHEHFEHESSPEGTPWQHLTYRYVERPRNKGGRGGRYHPILFLHGWLHRSITYNADDAGLAVGTNRKFPGGRASAGAIHQLSGTAGHGAHIPARPFLGMNDSDTSRVADFIIEYLAKL